jgi:hypothetical protein
MEVWEYLCKEQPANAEYVFGLAESYRSRSWRKKALVQYRRGLELDRNNSGGWISYIRCHVDAREWDEAGVVCRQALDNFGKESDIHLYFLAYIIFESDDDAFAEQCLQDMVRKAKTTIPDEDEYEEMVLSLLTRIEAEESIRFFPYVKELAALLSHVNDDLRERLEWAEKNYSISMLEEKGFEDLFYDLLRILNNISDTQTARDNRIALEYYLLAKKDISLPQIIRLKTEFPNLYDLNKDFFDEALGAQNLKGMIDQRIKKLAKHNLVPMGYTKDGYTDDREDDWAEPIETIRRESPKIGRNDPCPCGSGK